MGTSIKSPQIEDNANKALDITRGLPNFLYVF
jgi:hypothetical protein